MPKSHSARGVFGRLSRSAALGVSITVMASLAAHEEICRVTAEDAPSVTCGTIEIQAISPADVKELQTLTPGTMLVVPAANAARTITIAPAQTGPFQIVYSLGLGVLAALIYAWVVTLGVEGQPRYARWRVLVIGQDNRYSNSKVQATAWMGVFLISYMATSFLRLHSGMDWGDASSVGISDNLLTMAGLSAAAAGGAKIITGTQSDQALATKGTGVPRFWKGLFQNDKGQWDVGDAQMIIVTASALIMFIGSMVTLWSGLTLAAHIDLPVPGNVLTFAFGGSLGGYLAKKIGGSAGQS